MALAASARLPTLLRYALEKYGLVPDKDVAILQIGSQPARMSAQKGQNPRRYDRHSSYRQGDETGI